LPATADPSRNRQEALSSSSSSSSSSRYPNAAINKMRTRKRTQ
jgi:hypothetical protein